MGLVYKIYNIEDLKPCNNICLLYETDNEHKAFMTSFLRFRLKNKEKVVYIVNENNSGTAIKYLHEDGLEPDPYLESGQLTIITLNQSNLKDEDLFFEMMIKSISEETTKALDEGYTSLCAVCEMSGLIEELSRSERIIEFEAKIQEFIKNNQVLVLDQYDTRVLAPELLLNVLNTYPIAIIGTEIYENFYYISPERLLSSNIQEITLEHWKENLKLRKQLKLALKEKEILIKEIHHRVKNNLMIISSLLDIQSRYLKDKESIEVFKDSQNRALSMAIIHELLYQSSDLKSIELVKFINSLSKELFRAYGIESRLIKLEINVDDVNLDIDTAIPLGLITNELITNSLKYAFPEGESGEIKVDFHSLNDHYEFTVKDNGVGFPAELDFHNTDSLGLKLVTILTDQIEGVIELDRSEGTFFKITF